MPAGTRNAIRQPPCFAATPATIPAIIPPSAKLVHQNPITRPRTRRGKNSPMFLVRGAQPLDWNTPWSANNRPNPATDAAVPIATATATLPAMPASTTRRVPSRSPSTPQRNCPRA